MQKLQGFKILIVDDRPDPIREHVVKGEPSQTHVVLIVQDFVILVSGLG